MSMFETALDPDNIKNCLDDRGYKIAGYQTPAPLPALETSNEVQMTRDISLLAVALSKAQAKIEGAKKDVTNPHFNKKYADLASVWEAIRTPLTDNGLAVIQLPTADGDTVSVTTILTHASGQFIKSKLTMKIAGSVTPQSLGSALTYARRYSLSAVVGVAPEDDDANEASGKSGGTVGASKVPSNSWTSKPK